LPILTETVLQPGPWFRFEATVTPPEFATFNQKLNVRVGPDKVMQYKHTKALDTFSTNSIGDRVRISYDERRERVIESMVKTRLGDLAIFMPNRPLDVRISVNLEMPAQAPPPTPGEVERLKDRRTYVDTKTSIQYDLTEVSQTTGRRQETKLEVEMEAVKAEAVMAAPFTFLAEVRQFSRLLLN
jgi:hypothetical protein